MVFPLLRWFFEVVQKDAKSSLDGVYFQWNCQWSQEGHSLVPMPMHLRLLGQVSVRVVVHVRLRRDCSWVVNQATDPSLKTPSNSLSFYMPAFPMFSVISDPTT